MPPSIKASYSAETGHSELGLAGMMAGTISRAMSSTNTEHGIRVFKRYWWWYVNSC